MAIQIGANFDYKGKLPNFDRDNLSLSDLKNTNPASYDEDHFVCIDGKFYIFNSNNTYDNELGYWREFQAVPSSSSADPTTGNITTVTNVGGIIITTITDVGGNTISQTADIPGGISGTTTTDPTTGETTSTGTIGGVFSTTTTDSSGNTYSIVGDRIVSGSMTETSTTTTTDSNGNPVTTTVTTTRTPNGTEQTTSTDSIDPSTGNTITTVETVNGGSDGVDVGRSDGIITTTETDSDGNVVSTDTTDVSYNNGKKQEWMSENDVDNLYQDILGTNLGWDI